MNVSRSSIKTSEIRIIDRATPPHIKPENSFQWLNRITITKYDICF